MKKKAYLTLPSNNGGPPAVVTVTIDGSTPQVRNRIAAYLQEFEAAEALVLDFRGKTTQLVEIWADEDTPLPSLYRCWIGSQFAGTILAKCEEDAQRVMRKHLLSVGYTRHSVRRVTVRPAVHKWPTKAFLSYLEEKAQ